VAWVLSIIEEHNNVPAKYFKKLVNTDDLWEVRISSGSNIFRLLSFFDGDAVVVLTYAFQKKTQKTPKERILNNLPISKQATIVGCTFENS